GPGAGERGGAEGGAPPRPPRLRGEPVRGGRARDPLPAQPRDDHGAVVDHLGHEHPWGTAIVPRPARDPAGEPVAAHPPRIFGLQRDDVGHAAPSSWCPGGAADSGLARNAVRTIRTFRWL